MSSDLAQKVVDRMYAKDSFSQWLGISVLQVAPGVVSASMLVRDDMLNGFGLCHGAIPFALADSVLAFASNSHGRVSVSIEANIAYPKKVSVGDTLKATASELSLTNSTGLYDVRVENQDGELVSAFRGTVYRTKETF